MKRIVYRYILAALGVAALFGLLVLAPAPTAQAAEGEKHVTFKVSLAPADPFSDQNAVESDSKLEVRRGETFLVVIEGTPQPGWHTYPLHQHTKEQGTVQLSKVRLKDATDFAALWPVAESEPKLVD